MTENFGSLNDNCKRFYRKDDYENEKLKLMGK